MSDTYKPNHFLEMATNEHLTLLSGHVGEDLHECIEELTPEFLGWFHELAFACESYDVAACEYAKFFYPFKRLKNYRDKFMVDVLSELNRLTEEIDRTCVSPEYSPFAGISKAFAEVRASMPRRDPLSPDNEISMNGIEWVNIEESTVARSYLKRYDDALDAFKVSFSKIKPQARLKPPKRRKGIQAELFEAAFSLHIKRKGFAPSEAADVFELMTPLNFTDLVLVRSDSANITSVGLRLKGGVIWDYKGCLSMWRTKVIID